MASNSKRWFRAAALGSFGLAFVAACAHEVDSPNVGVEKLEPELICNAQFPEEGLTVLIHGDGFTPLPLDTLEEPAQLELPAVQLTRSLSLDGSKADGMSVSFSGVQGETHSELLGWRNKQLMSMTLNDGLGLEAGLYSIIVTNPDGKSSAEKAVALAVVEPPRVERLVPPSLCNGFEDQRLNLEGENFLEVGGQGPSVQLESESGEQFSYPADALDECIEIEGLSESVRLCSVMSVEIPANALPEDNYDVFVRNPEPASCVSSDPVPLKVINEGPVLFYAEPQVTYNGINTKVTLFLTAVAEPFTVQIVPAGSIGPETELEATLVPDRDNRVQATVPEGTEPGVYDVIVNDDTGCRTVLEEGLTLTDDLSIDMDRMVVPFGHTDSSTPVTIFRAGGAEFNPTPRGFLNPVDAGPDDVAIQLESLTRVNEDELTAVVPEGTPVGHYDLIIVNPTGEVGLLQDAFVSLADAPPLISDVVPQSIVDQADQSIEVRGSNFSSASVSVICKDADGSNVDPSPDVSSSEESCDDNGSCTLSAVIDGSSMSRGAVCVVRVENADKSYGEFSAIGVTNSSFNLSTPVAGRPLNEPRRSLFAAAVKATSASRFVYAVGGDSGQASMPLNSVEFSPINVFGDMSDFVMAAETLGSARAGHAGTQIGRYLYVMGGSDGGDALDTAERALVLSPEETPGLDDLDLCLVRPDRPCFGDDALGDGLSAGEYSYRVSAVIDPADPENLGGETLASDPLILKLPDVKDRGILVKLLWTPPVDALGDELSGVTGYRIYRTPADGVPGKDEVLLTSLDDPEARAFIDDGTLELGDVAPLPQGSTSAWQALPNLSAARVGLGAAAARDPEDPDLWHVYALLSEGLTSYEHLTVEEQPNGRQTIASGWTTGSEQAAVARSEFGVWVVDNVVSEFLNADETYIYLGGGATGSGNDDRIEAALVTAGGELAAFSDDPTAGDEVVDFSSTRSGYGTAAAAGRLFLFGGMGAQVRDNATAAELINPAPSLKKNSWNNEGLTMTSGRYRLGSAIQSAFIFLVGGQTDGANQVTESTEWVVW